MQVRRRSLLAFPCFLLLFKPVSAVELLPKRGKSWNPRLSGWSTTSQPLVDPQVAKSVPFKGEIDLRPSNIVKRSSDHIDASFLRKRTAALPQDVPSTSFGQPSGSRTGGERASQRGEPARRPATGRPTAPSNPPSVGLTRGALGLVRSNFGNHIMDLDRALTAAHNLPKAQVAIMGLAEEETVRTAMRRSPGGKFTPRLQFTPEERARSRKRHNDWLRSVHMSRQIAWHLQRVRDYHAHMDKSLALAGIIPVHRLAQDRAPPPRVLQTPQPRLLGTADPARLASFTQDWRGRHRYEKTAADPPLRPAGAAAAAAMDRKRSSQELADDINRHHGHQRHLRKSWSSEQFETDSGGAKKLSRDDDPMATKEQALRSGKLYRGHSFAYPGEMIKDNELSRAMRQKSGLPAE